MFCKYWQCFEKFAGSVFVDFSRVSVVYWKTILRISYVLKPVIVKLIQYIQRVPFLKAINLLL